MLEDYCWCTHPVNRPRDDSTVICGICGKPPRPVGMIIHSKVTDEPIRPGAPVPTLLKGKKVVDYIKANIVEFKSDFEQMTFDKLAEKWHIARAHINRFQKIGLIPYKYAAHDRHRISDKEVHKITSDVPQKLEDMQPGVTRDEFLGALKKVTAAKIQRADRETDTGGSTVYTPRKPHYDFTRDLSEGGSIQVTINADFFKLKSAERTIVLNIVNQVELPITAH